MKYISLVLFLAVSAPLMSCQQTPQQAAKVQFKEITETVKKTTPGFTATSENGYYMKAVIGGKQWVAEAMLPADHSESRRIQGEGNGKSIGFYIWMPHLQAGDKIRLKEGHAADLLTDDEIGIWGGRQGGIEITRMDGQWIEGVFHFTASGLQSDKTMEVTDGFFRLPLNAQNH
jgi:hypothetical protein